MGPLQRWLGTPEPDLADAPSGYPHERVSEGRLSDGTALRIRPILDEDGPELRAGLRRLSERTRWLRFHAVIHDFTDETLQRLAQVDHHAREALIAEVKVGSRVVPGARHWQPVAVARWEPLEPGEAEFAIVVEDAYQGRGIGGRLLAALAEAARSEGLGTLRAEVLAENRGAVELFRRMGPLAVEHDGTVLHVRVDVTSSGTAAEAGPGE